MDIKNIILITVAILDVIIGTILIFRNRRSPINISFAIVLYSAALWAWGIAMFRESTDMEIAASWMRMMYFAAAIIALAFLTFANYYIYKLYELDIVKIIYFLLPFIFITFIVFHPTFFLEKVIHYEWGNDANPKLFGHLIYAIYLFSYIVLSFILLFKKLKGSDGINRINLLLIIIVTIPAFIIGTTFDLILPILGNYKLIWIGPNSSSLASFLLIYLIFIRGIRIVK